MIRKSIVRAALLIALSCSAAAAQADVVVVMSARSDVSSLTAAQVSQIFLAKSSSLPGGGRAIAVDQSDGSPVRDAFYTKVTNRDAAQLRSYWSQLMFTGRAQRPRELAGDAAVKREVVATPGTIGYIDASSVDASVKVVLTP